MSRKIIIDCKIELMSTLKDILRVFNNYDSDEGRAKLNQLIKDLDGTEVKTHG